MFYVYFLIQKTPLNWRELGEAVNRDHATAMHYFKKVEYESEVYDDMKKIKSDIKKLIAEIFLEN